MQTPYIKEQNKIDFIKAHIRRRINLTRLADTPACQELSKVVDLSSATILKALKGEFTRRTIKKMIGAGWFTAQDYRGAGSPPQQNVGQSDARRSNDHKVQNKREKAAFKRGYESGLKAAQVAGSSAINGAVQAAYDRGFSDGQRQGYAQGKHDGRNEHRPQPQQVSGIDMDRLTSLFNLTVARGATQGEMVAARRAAGRTISKWIKERFGQDVQVDVN
jgi:hypothetical protein